MGGKNYRLFIAMVILTFISMLFYLISLGLLWTEHSYQSFIVEMGIVWASGIIILVFLALIFNLILLHIYLQYLGITTYQFIMMDK